MRRKFLHEEIQESINKIESNLESNDLSNVDRDLEVRKSLFLGEILMVIKMVGTSTDHSKIKFDIWLNRNKSYRQSAELLGVAEGSVKTVIRDYDERLRMLIDIPNGDKGSKGIKGMVDKINNCRTLSELEGLQADFRRMLKSLRGNYFRK